MCIYAGGKAYGQLKKNQENNLDEINRVCDTFDVCMRTKHVGKQWFVDYRFVSGLLHKVLRLLYPVLGKPLLKSWH